MTHKNIEIRAKWTRVANEGKESGIKGWNRWYDGGRIDREVLQMLCTLFLKIDRRKTRNTKYLAILNYFDLKTRNMMNRSLLAENHVI